MLALWINHVRYRFSTPLDQACSEHQHRVCFMALIEEISSLITTVNNTEWPCKMYRLWLDFSAIVGRYGVWAVLVC